MGRCGDPANWLGAEDEELDAGHEDVFNIDSDAQAVDQHLQVEYQDISDAEETPDAQLEDISESDDTPLLFEVDGIVFELQDGWPSYAFEEGQSTSYFVNQAGQSPQVYTLYNWDRPSGSWALWYQYMYACELLYGESVRNQLTLYYFTSVGDIKNFGRVLKDAFDILFVRCD